MSAAPEGLDERDRVIMVEYLEPTMSKELLSKFPDDSAFGFDYGQSGIWSPVVPWRSRAIAASVSVSCPFGLLLDGYEKIQKEKKKNKKKKQQVSAVKEGKIGKKTKKKKARKDGRSGWNVLGTPDTATPKGWVKVLRAATRRFQKRTRSPGQLMLPSNV